MTAARPVVGVPDLTWFATRPSATRLSPGVADGRL